MTATADFSPPIRSAPSHLLGISAGVWLRLLRENRFGVDAPFLLGALSVTAASIVNSVCSRLDEYRFDRTEAETADPIFVVGHWRSGTTLLHNLLAVDKRFATPDLCQAFFPNSFITLGKPLRWLLDRLLPRKRVIDEVEIGPELPQEDEFALCALTGLSPYVAYAFPRNWPLYNRYLTFEDVPDAEICRWQNALRNYVRKLGRVHKRPLVLKSPPHTARIRHILEVFPDARFVHVHRNPYDVFQSSFRALSVGLPLLKMQRFDFDALEDMILRRYDTLYTAYLEQQSLIPKDRLHEIAFEDLTGDPEGTVESLYRKLGLPDYDAVAGEMRRYIRSLSNYRPNSYASLSDDLAARIEAQWSRFFAAWGYSTTLGAKAA